MFDIVAPASSPQVYVPPLGGVQHPLAPAVMDAVRKQGSTPVGLWKIVNSLASARNPNSRAQRRCWRLRFLGALRELLKAKLLHRHGSFIAAKDFAPPHTRRSRKRLAPSARRSASKNAGSDHLVAKAGDATKSVLPVDPEVDIGIQEVLAHASGAQSAAPTPADISAAAQTLARRPRPRKKWSGWLHGERMWRSRKVIVPGGQVLPAYLVRRGWVYVLLPDTLEYQDRIFHRYPAEDVQVYRSPEAALLGRLPPGPGRRPRGRPRRIEAHCPPAITSAEASSDERAR